MKHNYSKSLLALALAAVMAIPASANVKATRVDGAQPTRHSIVTDTKTADLHWLKTGKVQTRKQVKEFVAPNGHKYSLNVNNLQQPTRKPSRADEELDVTVNLSFPEVEGFTYDGPMGIMAEIGGYNSTYLLPEDDENFDVLQSAWGVPAGKYAVVVETFLIGEDDFIGIFYQTIVQVNDDGLEFEVDFADCDRKLTFDMVDYEGNDFAWGTEDAPFVSLDFMSYGIDMGIWADRLCPALVNAGDDSCSYSAVASTMDRENLTAVYAQASIEGPFTEDMHASVTKDQYSYVDNTFYLTPQDKATGVKGLSYMIWTAEANGNESGQGGGAYAEGEAMETVGVYAVMGESETNGTCYLATIGTVTNYDEDSSSMESKTGGRKVQIGNTWYVVPEFSYYNSASGIASIFSPIDIFNIDCDEQEVKNFAFTPMANGNLSFWVYDLEDFIVADLGVGLGISGMFNEHIEDLNPVPYLAEITVDEEAIDPMDLLEKPMPDANMTVTYNYDNVYVNGEYPAYTKVTSGFYTYSDLMAPGVTGFQLRCNDKITNIMDPDGKCSLFILAAGYDEEYNLDLSFDWTLAVAEEGSDEWIPVTLAPENTYTDFGAMCAVDLAALGLKEGSWYKLATRVSLNDYTFNQYELGHCFYFGSNAGVADSMINNDIISTTYYDLNGRQIAAPSQGVYLRKSVLSDGTVVNDKIIK